MNLCTDFMGRLSGSKSMAEAAEDADTISADAETLAGSMDDR